LKPFSKTWRASYFWNLDQISSFWNLTWHASYFWNLDQISSFWNLQKLFEAFLVPDSKLARTIQKQGAQAIFGSGPKIWFLEPPENCFETFLVRVPKLLPERFKSIPRKLFLV